MGAMILYDVDEDGEQTEQVIPAREHVWEHRCGSQFFYLLDDGSIECGACHGILPGYTWHRPPEAVKAAN